MKYYFTLIILFFSISIFAQKKKIAVNTSTPVVKKASTSLPKQVDDNMYNLRNIPVKIENGHGEKVIVLFNARLAKYFWDDFVSKKGKNEKEAFGLAAFMLSLEARYSLKNKDSFEPFKTQFISENGGSFVSLYKMMGRNGYGNLIESSALVEYNPDGDNSKNQSVKLVDSTKVDSTKFIKAPKLIFIPNQKNK